MQSDLSSRQTNRSNISSFKPQQKQETYNHPSNDIFNHSFYEQKLGSGQSYQSVEYVKRYMKQSNLCVIVQKIMSTLLHLQKLPHNPFNLMYRLTHHEAIYENLRRHYNQAQQQNNFLNNNLPDNDDYDSSRNIQDRQELFIALRLKQKEVFVTQRLSKYLNIANLFVFAKLTHNKKLLEKMKVLTDRNNIKQVHLSIGGAILLNLRGNGGNLDVPVKLPKQTAQKSIFCAESMLTSTVYVEMGRQFSKCFNDFVDFILSDIRQSMGFKDEHHTVFFQKLQVFNIDEIFSLLQFSRDHLINQTLFVQKQLLRSLQRQNVIIRTKNIYRLSRQLASVVGEEFITVYKQYVLLAEQNGLVSVVSNEPLRYLFKEIFFTDEIIEIVLASPDYKDKQLLLEFKKQMVYHLLYELKQQNINHLVWEIFYYLIYEGKSTQDNFQYIKQLFHTLSYMLLSPISFVHQLSHTLKCAKLLTLPSFPTLNQNQAYKLIIQAQKDITTFVQKGNYVYWELEIFYEAIKILLSLVIEYKQLKLSSINFIIDHALLMLSGVSTNFNHILLVLQGNITNYINGMCRLLADSQGQSEKKLTYDLFLKQKQLPTRVLKVQQEVKKIKKQLSIQESQAKSILIGKYTCRYQLYEKIYEFYWSIVVGKKFMFPLSYFLKLLMINSTQASYQFFKQNHIKPKYKIQTSTLNGINIYELNNTQSAQVFYALHPLALQPQALKQYKNVFQLVEPFVSSNNSEHSTQLGFRYGSKHSVESNPSAGSRTIISVKSIDLGDNTSEQSSSFSVCKVLIDLVISRSFLSKNDIYGFLLEWITNLMLSLDRQNISVLGLFSYQQNHYQPLAYDDCVYSRILNEDNTLRFDYKKKISMPQFSKFIDYNINQGRFVEIKAIYTVRDVTKVMKLGINFHYKVSNRPSSLFKQHFCNQRVFSSKKDLLSWCEIVQYKPIKQVPNTDKDLLLSVKRLQSQQEVNITEVLSDGNLGKEKGLEGGINKFKYYRQSPFYNILRKVSQILQVLLAVVEYLKTDRRGRFDLSHLNQLYQLLKYFLMQRCLLKDDYIYSEGVSVSMLNLLMLLSEYFQQHPDNSGQERQLLQFEKIIRKLWGLVKYAQISCTICIHHSLNRTIIPDS